MQGWVAIATNLTGFVRWRPGGGGASATRWQQTWAKPASHNIGKQNGSIAIVRLFRQGGFVSVQLMGLQRGPWSAVCSHFQSDCMAFHHTVIHHNTHSPQSHSLQPVQSNWRQSKWWYTPALYF